METRWIIDIMSVMFLMQTQEFGGTVMIKISLKLVILPKGVYIRDSHKKKKQINVSINRCIIFCLYQNNPSDKIQLYYFSRLHQHVQNQSYEESN